VTSSASRPHARTSDYGCQYRSVDSPVHRLGAGTKLLVGTTLSAAAVLADRPWTIAAIAGLDALYYFGARLTLSDLWRDTKYLVAQTVLILVMYSTRFGFPAGLWPGLRIAAQIGLFFIPGAVFLRTTQASQMMRGLRRVLPYHLSFLVFTSFRFVPLFAREIRDIATAQRLRGARLSARDLLRPRAWSDAFHCLMIPLLVRALRTATEAALSAEARGFGSRPERSYFDATVGRPTLGRRERAPAAAPGASVVSTHPGSDLIHGA
jgi:energy-coupling factor transport system permease protein